MNLPNDSLISQLQQILNKSSPNLTQTLKAPNKQSKSDPRIRWSPVEHELFLNAIEKFGRRKHSEIAEFIQVRSCAQVVSHSQKMYEMMDKISDSVIQNTDYCKKFMRPVEYEYVEVSKIVYERLNTKVEQISNIQFTQQGRMRVAEGVLLVPQDSVQINAKQIYQFYCCLISYVKRRKIVLEYITEKLGVEEWIVHLVMQKNLK
ncbi:Myb-like_DNA-binding domain-containing protein [Hexamita inflata]|uniref:Myb-like DNA-binding domain-containing protein n=1 Tax=Hexamita inflata TaxID=28002 RepID=A0AA86NBY9_9EUKA|nr:Myb-like DNA-binding domain-containing protein [Hexamita inflata]